MRRTLTVWTLALAFGSFGALGGCKKAPHADKANAEPAPAALAEQIPVAEVVPPPAPDVPPPAPKAEARPGPTEAPTDVAKAPADAQKSRSGLVSKQLFAGTGKAHPSVDDTVFIHHATWNAEGKMLANSWRKKEPKILRMDKLMEGWREGLALMVVGERRRLWIPEKLALARSQLKKGSKGIRVVDIELLRLKQAPPAPDDVRRPPKDAKKTNSGIAWRSLTVGEGGHPPPTAQVTVRYAGWTNDGHCFDHTDADETMTFPLNGVIAGWSEGVQLMAKGGKTRFWIPEKLAYDGQQGKPKGMLVFDIELIAILP